MKEWISDQNLRELNDIRDALNRSAIVAITDRAGTIIHVNDKFCEISKYSKHELLGQNHRIINSGYHSKEFFIELWRTIASGKVWGGEIRNKAKDGSFYWVYTTIVPFLDERGKPHQYVSIRFEITQRKLAEEQVALKSKQLEESNLRLAESNRELQDFASVAAHDLQEPLRKIQSFSNRLQNKFRDLLPSDGVDYLDRMQNAAFRMQCLIEALLTYSRVTTQGRPFVRLNLGLILRDVMSDLEVRIEKTKAEVRVGDLPEIQADPMQMQQLFQNLLSNALKFIEPERKPIIEISGETRDGVCIIEVKDNGIGFDEKYANRIFTIFQRLHGRLEYEGTGIGLSVCRRIVERHGGSISAMSKPNEGAIFTIRLPSVQR